MDLQTLNLTIKGIVRVLVKQNCLNFIIELQSGILSSHCQNEFATSKKEEIRVIYITPNVSQNNLNHSEYIIIIYS
jgi:hypothetical protein